jgi:hypothetical protein
MVFFTSGLVIFSTTADLVRGGAIGERLGVASKAALAIKEQPTRPVVENLLAQSSILRLFLCYAPVWICAILKPKPFPVVIYSDFKEANVPQKTGCNSLKYFYSKNAAPNSQRFGAFFFAQTSPITIV